MFTSDFTDLTDVFCFYHKMNPVNLIVFSFANGFHRFHGFFSLSPDEPDGWRNGLSGSSGSSGDYKNNVFHER